MTEPILKVKDLQKLFPIQGGGLFNRVVGNVRAVDGLNLRSCWRKWLWQINCRSSYAALDRTNCRID
jgi:hypothetical protein